ncbi:hypothetical protein WMY93_032585 [Mugilogobius chulae]|uniref:Uncharacterized protein n=1 Tax=Mugilogobius chulae TaxID=88201 RepID=A0AAW0MMQ8_9GOBI
MSLFKVSLLVFLLLRASRAVGVVTVPRCVKVGGVRPPCVSVRQGAMGLLPERVLLLLLLTVCVGLGACSCWHGSWGSWAGVVAAAGALMFWARAWSGDVTLPCAGRSVLITGQ